MKQHIASVHGEKVSAKPLRIASLNIGRGLFGKEELLIHTINEQKIDILSVSECDLEDFNESKPFSIKGYKTVFPLKRAGINTKRLLCFKGARDRLLFMSKSRGSLWIIHDLYFSFLPKTLKYP